MTGHIEGQSELAGKVIRLEEELRSLAHRLDEAERGSRRWRRAGAGVLAMAALLVAGGAAHLGGLVPRLDVVGPNNDVRVSIGVNPATGSAGVEIIGLNGRKVAFLGTSDEGIPNLALYDPAGVAVVRSFRP